MVKYKISYKGRKGVQSTLGEALTIHLYNYAY